MKMKKILLLLPMMIAVVLVVSFSLFIMVQLTLQDNPDDTVAVLNAEYEKFSKALNTMSSQYPVGSNALIVINKEDELQCDADGNYLITEDVFESATGLNVDFNIMPMGYRLTALSNEEPLYNLESLAAENNYQVTDGEVNVILTRKFATKRLIISTETPLNDLYGAVSVTNYFSLYILQYATEAEAQSAYEYYLTQTNLEVWADELCWVDDEVEETNSIMPLGFGESYSYKTWGAKAMNVDVYSKYLTNLVSTPSTGYSKLPEVVVAVLDTGIDTDHPWFSDRFLRDKNNNIIGAAYPGDLYETGYSFEDNEGHGTHCAGIICDMTLPNVKILPIKFMYEHEDGKTYGSGSDALSGIAYAISIGQTRNLVAINMSFGSTNSGYYDALVNAAYNLGIFSVTAAGNDNTNADEHHPSNIAKAISVSSINSKNEKSTFSNYGNTVDVCAPGTSINSASITGGTITKSGTSMATPHIAAYIALLKSDPSKNYTMTDIENILYGKYKGINTVYDLGDSGKDIYFGYGLPYLNYLTPDYTIVNIKADSNGTVSPLGSSMYFENRDNIILNIKPDKNYQTAGVYIDNKFQANTKKITQYTLPAPSERFLEYNIQVKFEPADVVYTINHYLEPLYDLNDPNSIPEHSAYTLYEVQSVKSSFGKVTTATAKNYIGFTAMEFAQKTLTGDTVINIYYKRNQYNVSIEDSESGLENLKGPGKYLYGAIVDIQATMKIAYEKITWSSNITITRFDYNVLNQSFVMPASDIELTAKLKFKTFLLNVKVFGDGGVSPMTKMVNYGDSVSFQFTPGVGHKVKVVYLNGVDIKPDGLTYVLNNITFYVELTVYFTEISNEAQQGTTENVDEDKNNQSVNEYNNRVTSTSKSINAAVWGGICSVLLGVLICTVSICILSKRK